MTWFGLSSGEKNVFLLAASPAPQCSHPMRCPAMGLVQGKDVGPRPVSHPVMLSLALPELILWRADCWKSCLAQRREQT